ncbi:MAG: sporulation protein YunB [Clostridia bacterium]|jgi:sporulation protein YunB|nr:sporulation protein YunB [Clostridia bacterium]MDD4572097.1 sporulation protein YunB [Clostridia bacterium]
MSKWGSKRCVKKPIIVLLTMLLLSTVLLLWIDTQITPIINLVAEQRIHLAVIRLINEVVEEEIANEDYNELVKIEKNEEGYITLVQPNSIAISTLSNSISQNVEVKLRILAEEGIAIPSGVISGITLLANIGPPLHVKVTPVGHVEVEISDEFIAVGINQSKHRLNLNIYTVINFAVPFNKKNINTNVSLPLVETIIVGPVPNTYLEFGK